MKAVFSDIVLADWGSAEMSSEDWSFDDVVEEVQGRLSPDRVPVHSGGRVVGLGFTSARQHASYSAASAFLARHVRLDLPRATGRLVISTRDEPFGPVAETVLDPATVSIAATRRVGVTTFVTYRCRGTLSVE